MVTKILYEDCPICKSSNVHKEVEEGFFCGVKRCTVCLFLKLIDEEWPRLIFRDRHRTFAFQKFPTQKGKYLSGGT